MIYFFSYLFYFIYLFSLKKQKLFTDHSKINDIVSYLEVADGCDHKKELANEYLGLCKQWIEYASKVSSVEINGLLQV